MLRLSPGGAIEVKVLHFAHVINHGDWIDGALRNIDATCVEALAVTGVPPSRIRASGTNDHSYRTQVLGYTFSWHTYPRMLTDLVIAIRAFRPDIVHSHHFHESFIAPIAITLAASRAKLVVGHNYSEHLYLLTRGAKQQTLLAMEAYSHHRAISIVVPTPEVAEILIGRQSVAPSKVLVVPYAMDCGSVAGSVNRTRELVRATTGLAAQFVAVNLSRLNPEKGLQYLIQAIPIVIAALPDFHLVICGGGPLEAELRDQIVALGLEKHISLLGRRDDALDWLGAADVVVQSSLAESMGQVLVEALCLRKPVISTPTGAAPEILGAGGGWLVPFRDPTALASAILEVHGAPKEAAVRADRGFENAKSRLDPKRIAAIYCNLYSSVLESAPKASDA